MTSRRIEICYPHLRGVHVLKDSNNEDILKALMGVRTDGHLRRLLLPLILPDEHTVRLHSAGFRAMVEAAVPLDPHMKGRFYPSDIFDASSNTPVHRLSVHQDPSSSNTPMRSMGSFSGALSSVQEAFSLSTYKSCPLLRHHSTSCEWAIPEVRIKVNGSHQSQQLQTPQFRFKFRLTTTTMTMFS